MTRKESTDEPEEKPLEREDNGEVEENEEEEYPENHNKNYEVDNEEIEEYNDEEEYTENHNKNYEVDNEEIEQYHDEEDDFEQLVRFDPKKKGHQNFEVEEKPKNKRENGKQETNISEKKSYYFDVSLKEKLTNGESDFSFLNLFGPKEIKMKPKRDNLTYNVDEHKYVDLYDKHMDYHCERQNDSSEHWWEDTLFFSGLDDARLIEGVDFFKTPIEINVAAFHARRNEIKNIVRSKLKHNASGKNKTRPTKLVTLKSKLYRHKSKSKKVKTREKLIP